MSTKCWIWIARKRIPRNSQFLTKAPFLSDKYKVIKQKKSGKALKALIEITKTVKDTIIPLVTILINLITEMVQFRLKFKTSVVPC